MSDLISRADAICEVLVNDGIDNIVDRINELPSADAEPTETSTLGEKHQLSHGRLIDADTVVTVQVFDEMYEEYNLKTMTIAEALDLWTEEGCPSSVDAVSREDYEDIIKDYRKQYENMNNEIADLEAKLSADAVPIYEDGTLEVKVPNAQKVGRVLVMDTDSHIGGGLFYPDDAVHIETYRELYEKYMELKHASANAVQGYTEWLEKIIVDNEGANEWLCEDTPDLEWCKNNCHYSSIQAECLRHLYEVSKGGDDE